MDGVLADFDKFVYQTLGKTFDQNARSDAEEDAMWAALLRVERLYFQLEPMPCAQALWQQAHSYGAKVEVLTAIPRRTSMPSAEQDKREWIEKYFGTTTPVRIGPHSRDKWKHAIPADILIDDRHDNITDWINKAKGIGIQYTNFAIASTALDRMVNERL